MSVSNGALSHSMSRRRSYGLMIKHIAMVSRRKCLNGIYLLYLYQNIQEYLGKYHYI